MLPRTVVTDADGYRHTIKRFDEKDIRIAYAECGIRIAWFFGKGHPNPVKCPKEK